MVIECPHCHTRVIPRKDNTCPACHNDISDLKDVDPNVVSMVIHESQELPPFCYSCNSYTERHVRVSADKESYLENLILGPASPEKTSNVIIFLPQCELCAELGIPEPVGVDYDHQTMKFLVHRDFRDRVQPPPPAVDEQSDQSPSESGGW